MRFETTFKNIQATDAIRERAETKFRKAAKHLHEPIEAHMVLHVEKHRHCAELTVTAHGETFKAQEETDDMYATIDGLMRKIQRTVRKSRERHIDRSHHGAPLAEALVEEAPGNAPPRDDYGSV